MIHAPRSPRIIALFLTILFVVGACEAIDEVTRFIDSISDGAPCSGNGQCLGGQCLDESQGFPAGYCTTLRCADNGCSGLASECFRADFEGTETTACYRLCNFDGTCERASEGYQCVQLDDTAVCLPPAATNAPVQGATGSACSSNLQCNGEDATCLTTFFGGYCSQLGCTSSDDCLDQNPCVLLNEGEEGEERRACLRGCSSDDDCRFNYSCQERGGARVCLEGQAQTPRNPDGQADGATCASNLNCQGGTCIRESADEDGDDVSYPGGYCTTRDCENDEECNGGICVSRTRSTACFATCESGDDCRQGYACRDVPEGRICDSIVEAVLPDPSSESGFEVKCGPEKSISFEMPQGTEGFYIAPFAPGGEKVVPTTLTYPDGSTLNIPRDYAFLAINPEILGSLAPILFPASDASSFRNAFGPGSYTLDVNTSASELCYYVIPKTSAGTRLDINLYFVGTSITASEARNDRDMAQVIQVVESIYSSMGIDASVREYIDASETVSQTYGILRDFYDVFDLAATSKTPGTTAEENLSVNVFLIEDFNISEAPGLLGVSTGIPGMAGLHGNSGAGLVFSTASLGSDNDQLGQTMAHEIGHFLGLRHTTEHGGSAHDPITDTPECVLPDLAFLCGDSDNFMFAFALGGSQRKTTSGQAFVVRRSPLVQ